MDTNFDNSHPDSVEAKLAAEIGPSLPGLVHEQGILAHYISMNEEAPTIKRVHERLADLVKQINHRYAHMHILEIGISTVRLGRRR